MSYTSNFEITNISSTHKIATSVPATLIINVVKLLGRNLKFLIGLPPCTFENVWWALIPYESSLITFFKF